jgi:hypothetical protein
MRYFLLILFCSIIWQPLQSQEVKSAVQVIAPSVQLTDKQILNTLQTSIQQFINNRKWTDDQFENREKVEFSLFFEIKSIVNASEFSGTLQIQTSRPVFGSSYKSSVFTFNDEDVAFAYREFEALDYQENQNVNDLTSLIAFYVNLALGYDYDSFGELGGTLYFTKAQSILNLMQGKPGWNQGDGKGQRNRFNLIEQLNNNRFQPVRNLVYAYHRKGMDKMSESPENARTAITEALKSISDLNNLSMNSLVQRVFFNAKWSEIVDIYKVASVAEKNNILELLRKIDSQNASRYEKIKS